VGSWVFLQIKGKRERGKQGGGKKKKETLTFFPTLEIIFLFFLFLTFLIIMQVYVIFLG